jgi:hypothetical protein
VHALSGTTLMLGAEVLFQLAQEWLLPATFAHHILALPSILAVDCEFRQCRGPEKIQKRWEPRMRARPSAALSNQNGRVLTHEGLGLVRYVMCRFSRRHLTMNAQTRDVANVTHLFVLVMAPWCPRTQFQFQFRFHSHFHSHSALSLYLAVPDPFPFLLYSGPRIRL